MKKSKNRKIKIIKKKNKKTYKNKKKIGGSYNNYNLENPNKLIYKLFEKLHEKFNKFENLTYKDISFLKKIRQYLYNLINIDKSGKGSGGIYFIETHSSVTGARFRLKPESAITIVFVTNTSRCAPVHTLKFIKDNIENPETNILNIFNHGKQLEMPEGVKRMGISYMNGISYEMDYVYEYRIHFPGTIINDQTITFGSLRSGTVGSNELLCEGIFPFTDNNLQDNLLFNSEFHTSDRPIFEGSNKIFENCKGFGMNNMINDKSLKKLYESNTKINLSVLINQLEEQDFRGTLVLIACRSDRSLSLNKTKLIRNTSFEANEVFNNINEELYTTCEKWFDKYSTILYQFVSENMSNFDNIEKYSIHSPINTRTEYSLSPHTGCTIA